MTYLLEGEKYKWELVIGLEVHAQINSKSKLFSPASTNWGAEPNSQVELVDCGMPGALPVINEYCVDQAILTGLSLNAEINTRSIFDRKNYFYPDLPQGYQISQFEFPVVGKGHININCNGENKKIGITRLHLEQDAGKSLHDQNADSSYIDLNRSGCALMEIVSDPDLRSPEEAGEYVKKLRNILRYIGSCDGNMEKGNLRADVNVSVRQLDHNMGTRCEIKNVNSIKFIQQAIEFEAQRQIKLLEDGKKIVQETRLFDPNLCETRSMRSKEESHDYRYFPDPDLPPLLISNEKINKLKKSLPELPDEKKNRFIKEFKLSEYDAEVIVNDKDIAIFFEQTVKNRDPKIVTSWITVELFSYLKKNQIDINDNDISPEKIGEFIDLISNGIISNRQGKENFEDYMKSNEKADEFVKKRGLVQVSDIDEINNLIDSVIKENPKMVDEYRNGKEKLFGFFVGQVMKVSKGKANPKLANELLRNKLKA